MLGTANLLKVYSSSSFPLIESINDSKICSRHLDQSEISGIDTAESYFPKYPKIQRIFEDICKNLHVTTKFKIETFSPETFLSNLEMQKRVLGVGRINTVLVHDPENLWNSQSLNKLNQIRSLKESGIFDEIGISIYDGDTLRKAIDTFEFNVVQIPINVANREFDTPEWASIFFNRNIKVEARSIFFRGYLTEKLNEFAKMNVKAKRFVFSFEEMTRKLELRPEQACFLYVNQLSYVDRIVIGVRTLNQIKEFVAPYEFEGLNRMVSLLPNITLHDIDLRHI